jgi:hypothetical protein
VHRPLAVLLLALFGCSSDDENPAQSRPYSAADELTATNMSCLPRTAKADASGRVPFRFVVALPSGDTTCKYGAAVTEATRAALAQDLATSVGVACELPQLTKNDYTGPDCTKSLTLGWCYVPTGTDAVGCVAHGYLSLGGAVVNGVDRHFVVLEP